MTERVQEIARVDRAWVGLTDRGALVLEIGLSSGCSYQAYQCILSNYSAATKTHETDGFAGRALLEALRFFKVAELSKAKDQAVFVERDGPGLGEYIRSLRRFPCDGGAVLDFQKILEALPKGDADE